MSNPRTGIIYFPKAGNLRPFSRSNLVTNAFVRWLWPLLALTIAKTCNIMANIPTGFTFKFRIKKLFPIGYISQILKHFYWNYKNNCGYWIYNTVIVLEIKPLNTIFSLFFVCLHSHVHTHVHIHMQACTHTRTHAPTLARMHARTPARTQARTHEHTHSYHSDVLFFIGF